MRVEHVRPFAEASVEVCNSLLGFVPERGDLAACPTLTTTKQVSALCGISGHVGGFVMLSMSARTASQIASKLGGTPVVTFDTHAASAIAEFANIIGGRSLTLLADSGLVCTLTPPTIIRGVGTPVEGGSGISLRIPLILSHWGELDVLVSIQGTEVRAAS